MQVSIRIAPKAKQLTITLTEVNWSALQQADFYAGEQQMQHLVTQIGRELTAQLLRAKVTAPPTLIRAGQTCYRKASSPGHYLTLYGPITVARPTYQTRAGGAVICPLEEACQLSFGTATPLLAEILSFKTAALTPREVAADLAKSHALTLSPSFIQQTARRVGQLAVAKAEAWQ